VADRIAPLTGQRPIINDGIASKEMRLWIIAITDRALILGAGSPENVVEARIGAEYADINGTTGSIKYFKKLDNIGSDKTQGWVLI
jgi:hypothetical protein